MVERLKLQAKKGGTFDMYEYMDACTLDMVCREYFPNNSMDLPTTTTCVSSFELL